MLYNITYVALIRNQVTEALVLWKLDIEIVPQTLRLDIVEKVRKLTYFIAEFFKMELFKLCTFIILILIKCRL